MDIYKQIVFLPLDGEYGWVIVFVTLICMAICDGVFFSFGFFLEPLSQEFHTTLGTIAIIGSLNLGSYLLAGKNM